MLTVSPQLLLTFRVATSLLMFTLAVVTGAHGETASHIFGNPEVSQRAPARTYHVENYELTLHFDEAKGEVFGDEVITLRPLRSKFHTFYLNSSELSIDSVSLEKRLNASARLQYRNDEQHLWITLDRDYETGNSLNVRIVYHGVPRTGLFFVNPNPSYPQWPHEVFTQGETEFNHYWFPCWDYPNDMAASETITTVLEGQMVVSNGRLVSVVHSGGHVTYDWIESVPHSSYLISLAVGPWRRYVDTWQTKPVDYYVLKIVDESTARRSFHLTPDMIGFFSRATGVDYPYEKYAQVAVLNYIFGGQENVSATTLTDSTLHDERAEQDYPSTNLVSHELGQHWFGDYVQARDWADIWLNEGFATYLEALYTQYHEGNDAYRYAIYQDQLAEQKEDRDSYRRPLVDDHFRDPMDMIDATTHEKGADVLEMLRYVVDGSTAASYPASQDETLFRSLHRYLILHRCKTVATHDLIEAVQQITGMDLGWFFHEWVFMAGHPDYHVQAIYDAARKTERVRITQTQPLSFVTPVFDMPIELAFYGRNGESRKVQVRDRLRLQEFEIPLDFEPQWADFDPDDFIDKTVQFDKSVNALEAEAAKDPSMMSRLWAVEQLGLVADGDLNNRIDVLARVLSTDGFYAVRAAAARSLGKTATSKAKTTLLAALRQPDSRVRTAVLEALQHYTSDQAVFATFVDVLEHDPSYGVEATSAEGLGTSGVPEAYEVLRAEILAKPEIHVWQAALRGLALTKDARAAAILLDQAQPGLPERVRLTAITALGGLRAQVSSAHASELTQVVQAALQDTFYPIQEAGEYLVGIYQLHQYEADIRSRATEAPMAIQREAAVQILRELHSR